MGEKFRCWSPDQFGEDEADGMDVTSCDAEDAASDYVEKRYDHDSADWPEGEIDVQVRDESGALHQCVVTTEYSPSFHSSVLKHGPQKPYPWELEEHERWKAKSNA